VHEAVANKLSVQFSDRGKQQLKNMPDRIHAFMVVFEEKKPKEEQKSDTEAAAGLGALFG